MHQRAPRVALGLLVLVVVVLVGSSEVALREARNAADQRLALTRAVGQLSFYDLQLTSDARLAVRTGDPRFLADYRAATPRYFRALEEVERLSPSGAKGTFARLEPLGDELFALETRAFALARAGRGRQGLALLLGRRYGEVKDAYGRTLDAAVSTTTRASDRRVERARTLGTAGLAVGLAGGVVAILLGGYFVRLTERLLARIAATTAVLKDSSLRMRGSATAASAATAQQAGGIVEVGATADEMAATAASIAAETRRGSGSARTTQQTMAAMREEVEGVAERSRALGERGQQIGEIVDVMTGVASTSSLLAVNAAIEAASAGEAGRGFAVVAREIRKLAEQSASSAKEIREIVAGMQAEIQATITATERGAAHARGVAELMEDTAERLDQTVSVTNEQREAADNVAAALAEIRDAAEQLSADQEERVALAKQIEALVAELEAVHRKPARTFTSAGGGAPSGRSVAVG